MKAQRLEEGIVYLLLISYELITLAVEERSALKLLFSFIILMNVGVVVTLARAGLLQARELEFETLPGPYFRSPRQITVYHAGGYKKSSSVASVALRVRKRGTSEWEVIGKHRRTRVKPARHIGIANIDRLDKERAQAISLL